MRFLTDEQLEKLADWLKRKNSLIVIGEEVSGKSTLIRVAASLIGVDDAGGMVRFGHRGEGLWANKRWLVAAESLDSVPPMCGKQSATVIALDPLQEEDSAAVQKLVEQLNLFLGVEHGQAAH